MNGEYARALNADAVPQGIPAEFAEAFRADGRRQVLNFIGRYTDAHHLSAPVLFEPVEALEPLPEGGEWIAIDAMENLTASSAIDFIVSEAQDRQIVIINEAHQMGEHRAFAAELLHGLRAIGFTHLGMEALSPVARQSWQSSPVPSMETGFYFHDPMMGHLLLTADSLGYEWFNYEQRPDQELDCAVDDCSREARIANREQVQASNIIEAVLADDPEARIVLFVGLAHLNERPGHDENGRPLGWMAAVLAERTGIDPLTVDQVTGSGIGPRYVGQRVRLLHDAFDFAHPSVLIDESGRAMAPPDQRWVADMVVFHPTPDLDRGLTRPDWLLSVTGRMPVFVDLEAATERPMIIQAFRAGAGERELPFDQIAILEGEEVSSVTLVLPAGEFELRQQTPSQSLSLGSISLGD